MTGGGHNSLRFVVGALTDGVRLRVRLTNDLLALARSGSLIGLRLLGGAEALLNLCSTLVHRLVDARQRVASDEEQDDKQNDSRPENLIQRRQDDGEAADLLVRSGDNLVHGDHLTMSGITKPMRPRASTMPAPIIMLVKRRPATSG